MRLRRRLLRRTCVFPPCRSDRPTPRGLRSPERVIGVTVPGKFRHRTLVVAWAGASALPASGRPRRRRILSASAVELVPATARRFGGPVFVGAVLLALLASQGGYFAQSWGWSALLFLLAIAVVAVVREDVAVSRNELALVGLIAGLAVWTAVSAAWSSNVGDTVLEAERALLYVAVTAAVVLAARKRDVTRYLLAVLTAVALVATYALCTRCWPSRFSVVTGVAGYRLARPIGYWNGLGILSSMGIVLAIGFLSGRGPLRVRAAAGAVCVPLVLTLYFTFSRGAWVALGFGLLVALAAARARLRVLAWTAVGAVAPTIGVLSAAHLKSLSSLHARLSTTDHAGTELGLTAAALIALAAILVLLAHAVEPRVSPSRRARQTIGAALAAAAVLAAGIGFASVGHTPAAVVRDLYHRFEVPTPTMRGSVDQRLFSFSSNGRVELWRTAWRDYRAHPWLGSGAGTYERAWLANPKSHFSVKDAHGLYIETLAELGPIGLLLLLGALLLPLVLTVRRGATPAVAGAAGASGAYLVHAGVDWDWELAGVTAVALALGALLLVERRRTESRSRVPNSVRVATIASAVVLSLFAAFAYVGNAAAGSADDDLQANQFQSAASQAQRAERLMPWSTEPPVLLAEAYLGLGDVAAARAELRKALAKDRGDWKTWLDLALASKGRARRNALAEASRLYPRSPEIASVRAQGGQP
jgi:hypothetical protein